MNNVILLNSNYSKVKRIYRALIIFFTSLYYAGLQALNTISWGRYFLLVCVMLLFILFICFNTFTVVFDSFIIWSFIFCVFCFCSSLWAIEPSYARSKSITIFQILFFCCFFYLIFIKLRDIDILLKSIYWGGILVSLFLFAFYGINEIKYMAINGVRFSGEIGNANAIGFFMVYTLLVTAFEIVFKKIKIYHLLSVLCLYILLISESRTAIIGLIIGVITLFLCKIKQDKKMKRFFSTLCFILVFIVALYFALRLPIFTTIKNRFENLFFTIKGDNVENSLQARLEMVLLGIEQFKSHPLVGNGIGNSTVALKNAGYTYSYYHNNYIEILSGCGIVGFVIWYYPFVRCFFKSISMIKKNVHISLVLSFLFSFLFMDIGTVSYYNKYSCFILMTMLVILSIIKKNNMKEALKNETN